MSGPVSPPLTVREADGSPSGRPINTIVVSNGDLSISGTIATIDTSGSGTIGGTIADTQVAFGSAADTIKGNDKFRYLESTGQLILTGVADDNAEFVIERSSGSSQKIGMENDSSASPKVTVSVPPNNAKALMLECHITDTAVTGGSQGFIFNVSNTSDQSISMLNILTTDSVAYDVVFNEDSLNDYDVRMEGSTEANLFVLKGSADNIGIGTFPASDVERLHVQTSDLATVLQRWETTASPTTADFAVKLEVKADGTPSVNGAGLGAIDFIGKDSGGAETTYARMAVVMADKGAGTEDGILKFDLIDGSSTNVEHLQMGNGNVIINEDQVTVSFRVEGDSNDSLIRTDAANDLVAIGSVPVTTLTQDPIFQISNQSGPASYRYIIPSTTSPMTLTNNDLQSPLLVHASATALTINLPLDGGVKGQYFQFVSTGGDITLVPSAVAGDTINGGTASLTRSTNNEIYDCVCIASNTWILSNPA